MGIITPEKAGVGRLLKAGYAAPMQTGMTIRLSERVQRLKPSATLAVTARVRAMKAEGRNVIGFGVGEPDFDTPAVIRQTAIDALNANDTHYAPVPGTPGATPATGTPASSETRNRTAASAWPNPVQCATQSRWGQSALSH